MSKVWELTKLGRYQEACDAAEKEALQSASRLPLRNKVFALLSLMNYQSASQLCQELIKLDSGESESDFIFLGVSRWLLEDYEGAIAAWDMAVNTKYTDAAGGVQIPLLLLYASIMLRRDELKAAVISQLEESRRGTSHHNWPGPLSGFMLGALSETTLLAKLSENSILRAKQLCQAAFFIGVDRFRKGDLVGYQENMQRARLQGAVTLVKPEYYLAVARAPHSPVGNNHS